MSYTLICDHSMDTRNCREGYVDAMYELMKEDPRIIHIDCDLLGCVGGGKLKDAYPDRVINAGIAEANAAAMAAGLQAKRCDAARDEHEHDDKIQDSHVRRNFTQRRKRNGDDHAFRLLAEKGKEQKQRGAQVEQTEDEIDEAVVLFLLRFLREGDHFAAGKQIVNRDLKVRGYRFERFDAWIAPARFPF